MLTPKEKSPLPEAQRRVEPITPDSEHNTIPTELFRPTGILIVTKLGQQIILFMNAFCKLQTTFCHNLATQYHRTRALKLYTLLLQTQVMNPNCKRTCLVIFTLLHQKPQHTRRQNNKFQAVLLILGPVDCVTLKHTSYQGFQSRMVYPTI